MEREKNMEAEEARNEASKWGGSTANTNNKAGKKRPDYNWEED
jgi:hypothetical protein